MTLKNKNFRVFCSGKSIPLFLSFVNSNRYIHEDTKELKQGKIEQVRKCGLVQSKDSAGC